MNFAGRAAAAAALSIGVGAAGSAAQAAVVIQSTPFTIAGVAANIGFQEFNPALGTLNSVAVAIDGTLSSTIFLAPGQSLTPIVGMNISNAGPRGFSFGTDAQLLFLPISDPGPPTSSGHPETISSAFSFDFTFTAATDLAGFALATVSANPASLVPPATVDALREDFIADPFPIGINEVLQLAPQNFGAPFSGGGSLTVTYDYTPFAVVTAPPAAPLLALGLAALAGLQRRRAR